MTEYPDLPLPTKRQPPPKVPSSTPVSPPVTVVWQPKGEPMAIGSSRLVARERKKILRQTILLLFLLIGFGLVFLFFIFPNAPRLITLLVPETTGGSDDTIPPQPPVLYSVPVATNSAAFTVEGYSEAKSTVTLLLNASEVAAPVASEDGTFVADITFTDGENTVTALAQDEAGNTSKESKRYTVTLDTSPPNIELASDLLTGQTVVGKDKQQYELTGKTEPLAKVLIADRFVFADESGVFRYPFDLQEGENKVTITAIDKAGNSATAEAIIIFRP